MSRLTEMDDCGNWGLKGVAWNNIYPGSVITNEVYEKIYAALHKLLDYEEVNPIPEDSERIDCLWGSRAVDLSEKYSKITLCEDCQGRMVCTDGTQHCMKPLIHLSTIKPGDGCSWGTPRDKEAQP